MWARIWKRCLLIFLTRVSNWGGKGRPSLVGKRCSSLVTLAAKVRTVSMYWEAEYLHFLFLSSSQWKWLLSGALMEGQVLGVQNSAMAP